MNLLQMSRSGAVMILAIVVIRALAINKLPKKAFLVLWGAATVRLLIPYSLPSAFSIYSLLGRFAPATEKVKDVPALALMIPAHNVTPMPGTSAVHTASVPIDPWTVVWLVGGLVCAVFFVVAYLKCHREFKASLPVDNEYAKRWLGKHHIYRTIEIRQSSRISAPLTYGVFRPVILMPKTADWDDLDTLSTSKPFPTADTNTDSICFPSAIIIVSRFSSATVLLIGDDVPLGLSVYAGG